MRMPHCAIAGGVAICRPQARRQARLPRDSSVTPFRYTVPPAPQGPCRLFGE